MSRFISEDDLKNFEGWLAYQGYDPEMLDSDDLAKWRELFEQISKRLDAKVGLMKLGSKAPDDRIYGVAVQDEGLWLTLWVRRSWKGDFLSSCQGLMVATLTQATIAMVGSTTRARAARLLRKSFSGWTSRSYGAPFRMGRTWSENSWSRL